MTGLTKVLSAAMIVGAFGLGAMGATAPTASAKPVLSAPEKPRHDDYCPPWCGDEKRGNDNYCPPWCGDDNRKSPPPWGWGPPPAYHWPGGPPRPFNYWGHDVNPVWNDGFRQWGFWLFGMWIPVFGIG
jgi:hypothetical protein